MKKLLMALGVAACAVSLQAAQIKWGGDVATASATAVDAGSVAYLIRGSTAAEAAITTVFVTAGDYTTWTTDTGAKIVKSYALSSGDIDPNYRFEAAYAISSAADAAYYSVVLVNGSAGAEGKTGSYNYAGQNTLADPTSGATTDLTIGDLWASGTAPWIGEGGFNAVTFAAPEPTSGLLLLIGMAGLALKRKRA